MQILDGVVIKGNRLYAGDSLVGLFLNGGLFPKREAPVYRRLLTQAITDASSEDLKMIYRLLRTLGVKRLRSGSLQTVPAIPHSNLKTLVFWADNPLSLTYNLNSGVFNYAIFDILAGGGGGGGGGGGVATTENGSGGGGGGQGGRLVAYISGSYSSASITPGLPGSGGAGGSGANGNPGGNGGNSVITLGSGSKTVQAQGGQGSASDTAASFPGGNGGNGGSAQLNYDYGLLSVLAIQGLDGLVNSPPPSGGLGVGGDLIYLLGDKTLDFIASSNPNIGTAQLNLGQPSNSLTCSDGQSDGANLPGSSTYPTPGTYFVMKARGGGGGGGGVNTATGTSGDTYNGCPGGQGGTGLVLMHLII